MTDNTAPCARPGCGAPKAWHTLETSYRDLVASQPKDTIHGSIAHPAMHREEGDCLGYSCDCPCYLAPEPPMPERKAYVVETEQLIKGGMLAVKFHRGYLELGYAAALADYLATHPRPPANQKCLVRDCEFYTASGLCTQCQASLGKFSRSQLMDGPQPAPALCVCGGDADDHNPVTGRCGHRAKFWCSCTNEGPDGHEDYQTCVCPRFRPAVTP